MSVVLDKLLKKPLLHDHTDKMNISGDSMTGALSIGIDGVGTDTTEGLTLINTTAATGTNPGTKQNSPSILLQGEAWNASDSSSKNVQLKILGTASPTGSAAGMKLQFLGSVEGLVTEKNLMDVTLYSDGSSAIAIGGDSSTSNASQVAIGRTAVVSGGNGIALGFSTTVTHTNSVAIGTSAASTKTNQVVLGNYQRTVTVPGNFEVLTGISTNVGATIKGVASQTANLTEWQDSSANVLAMVDSSGKLGIGATDPQVKLDVNDDSIRVRTSQTPATASATGNQGEIAWDSDYIYVCTATDTWKRAALATW